MPGSDDQYDLASRTKRSHDEYAQHLRQMEEEERRHHHQHPSGSISTPFAAFKRFVDDNLTTFTDNFKNLPSNIAELRANMHQEHQRAAEEERDISARWTGRLDWPDDHLAGLTEVQKEFDSFSRSFKDELTLRTRWMIEAAARGNAHVPLSKIYALYEDRESAGGLFDQFTRYYMPETGDTLPTASSWSLLGRPTPRWLSVDWFKRSPYSPIRLEAHPDTQWEGKKWRAAFEDLMCAALDKPMTAQQHRDVDLMPGLHWMMSLQDRHILPPLLPRFYSDLLAWRALQTSSMQDIIARCNPPWAAGRSISWLDTLGQDFAELRDAFAIMYVTNNAFDRPDAELEMYEQQHALSTLKHRQKQLDQLEKHDQRMLLALQERESLVESAHDDDDDGDDGDDYYEDDEVEDDDDDACPLANEYRLRAMQAQEWDLLREVAGFLLTGDRTDDFEDAVSAFGSALQRQDAQTAASILNTWYEHYQDLKIVAPGIVDATPQNCWETVVKAVDWCRIPELDETGSIEELMRTLGCFEGEGLGNDEGLRGELYRRLANVLPDGTGERRGVGWLRYAFMELPELEENIEALEQQKENLEAMMNGGKKVSEHSIQVESRGVQTEGVVQKRPDVLSALTTTQTTRLPDGTVTTKVVLKKRFADGREESSESVHTHHEGLEAEVRRSKEVEDEKKGSGKGWFWT